MGTACSKSGLKAIVGDIVGEHFDRRGGASEAGEEWSWGEEASRRGEEGGEMEARKVLTGEEGPVT